MIHPSELRPSFPSAFGKPRAFFAPGRINLIGEHTDYNDGFVLPMALDLGITILGARREDARVHVVSHQGKDVAEIEFDLRSPGPKKRGTWSDYVEGMAQSLLEANDDLCGAELLLASDLPAGAGLSSSAALEIGVGFALLSLSGLSVDRVHLAVCGQKAEHDWVGTRCGIMDQLVSARARRRSALLIDCRSLDVRDVPLGAPSLSILIADTRIKHSLASSAYNRRREECEEAVMLLHKALPHIRALRDVSWDDFELHQHLLPEPLLCRARHVITENERVDNTLIYIASKRFDLVGQMLLASHRSLQYDYEVSCPELDLLVDTALKQKGVLGARMTGGGFGGSIICLVRTSALDAVKTALSAAYVREFGQEPVFFATKGGQGAHEIRS